jgi:hypothetical protein
LKRWIDMILKPNNNWENLKLGNWEIEVLQGNFEISQFQNFKIPSPPLATIYSKI